MTRELKYSYLENERQKQLSVLEQARIDSIANLRSYWLEFTSWIWSLNFISKMKNAFRNDDSYIYKVDNFDDYSQEFYDTLKDFQSRNGLKITGVLDIETLVSFDKKYPNYLSYEEKAKILNYFQNKTEFITTETKIVSKETKEKIIKSELDLVSDNISNPKNQVLEKVRKSLGLTGNIEEMKKQIANFQKMHCLNETDWVIWKETYYEVLAKDYFTNEKQSEILEKWPTKADQTFILEVFQNGRIGSTELNKISIILKTFKEKNVSNANFEAEFWDFYKRYDALLTEYRNSPAWKVDQKNIQKNEQSFYSIIMDENIPVWEKIKKIATDPTLLLVGWALFLFGVVWPKNSYTDWFFKRAGWLLGWALFWPALWNKLWIWEAIDDATKKINNISAWTKTPEAQAQKNEIASSTHNFIVRNGTDSVSWVKTKASEIHNWIKTWDTSKLPVFLWWTAIDKNLSKEEIENRIYKDTNQVLFSVYEKNFSYSKSANESEKAKFIEREDFTTISNALHTDSDFTWKLIADVNYVKSDVSKLKEMLSADTKNTLFWNLSWDKLKKREQDLVTFVNLFLDEKESNDVYISDIFIKEKWFFDKAKDTLIENKITTYMKDDEKLNSEVNKIVSSLSVNIKSEVSSILTSWNFGDSEQAKKINEISDYINKNDAKIWTDKEKLLLLKNIYVMEYEYQNFVKNVDAIDKNDGKNSLTKLNEEKAKIDKKYNEIKLSKPANDSNKIFGEKIKEKISQKEKEIYDATADKDSLGDVKNKIENWEIEKKLDKIFDDIWNEKPAHNLESYRKYFSDDKRVLAYNKLFDWEYLCKNTTKDVLPCNWVNWKPVPPEIFSKINGTDLTEGKKRYNKIVEHREKYEEIVKNIKLLVDEDVKKIDNIKSEIEKSKTNTNLYKLKQEEFGKKLSEIVNRVYPNEKPESFTDVSAYIDYMNKNNRTSVYSEIISKLKAVNASWVKFNLDIVNKKVDEKNIITSDKINEISKLEKLKENIKSYKETWIEFKNEYVKEMNYFFPNREVKHFNTKDGKIDYDAYMNHIQNIINDNTNNPDSIDFDKKILTALSSVKNTLTNETKAVEKQVSADKKSEIVSTNLEVSQAYNEYYDKVKEELDKLKWNWIETVKTKLKNPKDLEKMTFKDLKLVLDELNEAIFSYNENIGNINKEIVKNNVNKAKDKKQELEKAIDTSKFKSEFNKLNDEIEKYYKN